MNFILKRMVAGALTAALLLPTGISSTAAAPRAALQFSYLQAFAASGTFVPPHTGKYRIYCVGRSADGSPSISGGGGGSGGVAVSELTLNAGQGYEVKVDASQSAFAAFLYATAAPQPIGMAGGAGGLAFGGNIANEGGFSGGNGAPQHMDSGRAQDGADGLNGGMKGGRGGTSSFGNRHPYGGAGGGARLPAICPYVAPAYTDLYKSAAGDSWWEPSDGGATRHTEGQPGTPYPPFTVSSAMVLYGGGGGANWNLPSTAGTPGVVIIERCTDYDDPVITGVTQLSSWAQSYVATVTATDATSGVAEYAISTTNSVPATGWTASNQFNITANGTYYAWARDNAGRVSPGAAFTVTKLDTQIPVVSGVSWQNEWAKAVTVMVSGTDSQSGVAAYACTSGNVAPGSGWQSTGQFNITANGAYYAWVKDQVGRVSLGRTFTMDKIDVTPPVVVSCAFSEGGLKAVIQATDAGSGVKGIYVNDRWTTGATVTRELSDNDLTLKIQAEDMVGNKSAVRTEAVPDQIPPTIDKITFAKDAASVQITASDRGNSKLKGVYVNDVLYPVDANGRMTAVIDNQSVLEVNVQAQDNAGNKSAVRTETVPDVLAPVVQSIAFSPDSKKAVITATDTGSSGLKGISVNGTFWEGSPVEYTLPENQWGLSVFAVDNAGNKSAVVSKVAPDVISPELKSIIFTADSKRVKIVASDLGSSGLKGVHVQDVFYPIETDNTVTADVDNLRDTEITVQVEDNAGNKSEARTVIVPDVLAPTVDSIVFSPDSKKVVITASDTGSSGLKGISVNGTFLEGSPVEFTLTENKWDLSIFAEDNAGNKSETVSKVAPDVIPPVIKSITYSADSKKVKIIASDLGSSGLKGIYVNGKFFAGTTADYTFPEGSWELSIFAEDNAGNKSDVIEKIAPDTIPPRIDAVSFSADNLRVTITASDEGSAGLAFIEINGEKYPVVNGKYTYKIPLDTQFLTISAIDAAENVSEVLIKRVPGWSVEIDTIAITSVEIAGDKKSAVIRADTSDPNREISGIFVNNLLHRVNPATVTIPEGTEQLVCQAIDNQGDKSRVVVRVIPKDEPPKDEIPKPPVQPEKPAKDKKTRITITQPGWTNGSKPVRVRVTASDADDGIDEISVKTEYDPAWEDITDEGYFHLTQDAMVTVRATNGAGEETTKSEEIRCFDDEAPTVSLRSSGDGKLTVTFRDAKSGVKTVTINGRVYTGKELTKGYITCTLPAKTDEVRVYAEDNAGNRSDREELTITPPPVPLTAKPSTRPPVAAQPENPIVQSDGSGTQRTTTTTTTSRRTKNAQFFQKMRDLQNSPRYVGQDDMDYTELDMKVSPDNRNQRMLAVGVSCGLFLLLAAGMIVALIVARRKRETASEEIL